MALLLFALLLMSPPIQSQNPTVAQSHPTVPQISQQSVHPAPAIPTASRQENNKQSDGQEKTNGQSFSNWIVAGFTVVIAFATFAQAFIMWKQGKIYEKQYGIMSKALVASNTSAEAAAKGVAAIEKLERPFLMVELRGNNEFKYQI
jgi:hypothetical protein